MINTAFKNTPATAQKSNSNRKVTYVMRKTRLDTYEEKLTGSPAGPLSPGLPGGPGKPWRNKGEAGRKSDA